LSTLVSQLGIIISSEKFPSYRKKRKRSGDGNFPAGLGGRRDYVKGVYSVTRFVKLQTKKTATDATVLPCGCVNIG